MSIIDTNNNEGPGFKIMEAEAEATIEIADWVEEWEMWINSISIQASRSSCICQFWNSTRDNISGNSKINSIQKELKIKFPLPNEQSQNSQGKLLALFNKSEIHGAKSDIFNTLVISTKSYFETEITFGFMNILSNTSYRLRIQVYVRSREYTIMKDGIKIVISFERHFRDAFCHSEWVPRTIIISLKVRCSKETHEQSIKQITKLLEEMQQHYLATCTKL